MRTCSAVALCCISLAACTASDQSITRGADGQNDWERRLRAVVKPGMTEDSAQRVMVANGFTCSAGVDSTRFLACSKDGKSSPVFRRWRGVFILDANRRVSAVRASTGMVGP